MPKLSDTMTEGTLVRWKKQPGDPVSMGEVIAEVETDKATMEMEAFEDGVLAEIFVQEGQKVEVGQKIARVGVPGEEAATPAEAKTEVAPKPPSADATGGGYSAEDAAVQTLAESPEDAAGERQKAESQLGTEQVASTPSAGTSAASTDPDRRVKASPLARKVATAQGIDLGGVRGTGPGERITQRDVLAAAENQGEKKSIPAPGVPLAPAPSKPAAATSPTPAAPRPAAAPAATVGATAADQRIPLTSMRKTIAERLLASKTQIPHFYLRIEVDAGPLVRLRSELNAAGESENIKFSVNDFILKAAVGALSRVPKVNASFQGDAVMQFGSVNLAVAVAVEDGLVTPVIRDAQGKSLREISAAVKDLATRARSKKLKPDEYQGGTFTVSNLGGYGIENFDAIINPPQAAILSVGALLKKPVVNERDEITVGHRMSVGLSCDHRVVDGALGAEYLAALRKLLERPALMLV